MSTASVVTCPNCGQSYPTLLFGIINRHACPADTLQGGFSSAQPEQGDVDNPEAWKGIGAQPDVERAIAFKNRPDIWEQLWKNANPDAKRSREQNTAWLMSAYAVSETAALRAKYEEVVKMIPDRPCITPDSPCAELDALRQLEIDLRGMIAAWRQAAHNKAAENERLQAIVATCERDIGKALADYHDSQAQLVQMSEALNAIDNLAAGVVCEKHINCPACRIMEIAQSCSSTSSAEWLEKQRSEAAAPFIQRCAHLEKLNAELLCQSKEHDHAVEEKVLRNLADIYQGEDDALTTGELRARADALAGEQPPTSPEA